MQCIRGKRSVRVEPAALAQQIAQYPRVLIDLGTGDGRYVRHVASACPDTLAIGIDLCPDNLREASRRAPANALYILASAYALPPELHAQANHITVNFPWAELLTGLLAHDSCLPAALAALAKPGARLEVRINGEALATASWTLPEAACAIRCNLQRAGFNVSAPRLLDARELRACPTTWAHRLAFGRDPRALYLEGVKGKAYGA